jgi:cell wall-associated NlpC family hydrolase
VRRPRLKGWRRQAPLFVGLLTTAGIVAVGGATAQPGGDIQSKQAEAQQVMARIQQMNNELEARVQSYDQATYELGKINHQLKATTQELKYARVNLGRAQTQLQARAVALYTSGQDDSTASVLFGATSLEDVMNRLDAANRVSRQDTEVVQQVTQYRNTVRRQRVILAKAQIKQQDTVARRAAEKGTVERQLAAQQSYLAHVNSQIRDLIAQREAAQRAASERLAAAAKVRLAQAVSSNPVTSTSVDSSATVVDSAGGSVAPSGHGDQIANLALAQQGKPYVWAAAGPDSFDCSGLVMYVYGEIGMSVPHSSYSLAAMGSAVPFDQLEPGDLVFFNGNSHVGIYIGGGNFVHAPHTGTVVQVASLASEPGLDAARRI